MRSTGVGTHDMLGRPAMPSGKEDGQAGLTARLTSMVGKEVMKDGG
jgi:hypothetical protein